MIEGCTIGAKIISNHFLMFKNKDLRYENFQDQVIFDDEIFAVTGINIGTEEITGVSIGVNKWGLAACSANVLTTDDDPYDLLLETIMRKSKSIEDAYSVVSALFESGKAYQWCNIVIATLDKVAAFEIGPESAAKDEHVEEIVRTNHHVLLSTKKSLSILTREKNEFEDIITLSEKRRKRANELIFNVSTLEDVMSLLSAHSETRGYDSICRHRLNGDRYVGETVYSYIFEVAKQNEGDLVFQMHVARSNPCNNPYERIPFDFNSSTDEKKKVVENFP